MACINMVAPAIPRGSDNPFYHHILQRRYDKEVILTMFYGHSNLRVYLQRYHLETISIEIDDDLLAKLFPLRLKIFWINIFCLSHKNHLL